VAVTEAMMVEAVAVTEAMTVEAVVAAVVEVINVTAELPPRFVVEIHTTDSQNESN
jgi:hypothetical protein